MLCATVLAQACYTAGVALSHETEKIGTDAVSSLPVEILTFRQADALPNSPAFQALIYHIYARNIQLIV